MVAYNAAERNEINEVICLAPNGLGYGEGSISSGAMSAKGLAIADEIIRTHPEVFVLVDEDALDDGCGDGRRTTRIMRLNEDSGVIEELRASRRRAKIFGGGLVVASSMWRSITGNPKIGETVLGDRELIAGKLKAMNITHGAHTDTHASGRNCGCGAIDKYPDMTKNARDYKREMLQTLQALYGDSFTDNIDVIDSIFATYDTLASNETYFTTAEGVLTRDLIINSGCVVKELGDDHKEGKIVLNDIEGTTFDQRKFADLLTEAGVTEEIQVFVVDVWRGRMYADVMAQIATDTLEGVLYEEARQKAYADFLIRTLAVAATLTKGDLGVYARMRDGRKDFALTT